MKPIYINKNKVAILLSCYSGERYMHELIYSIIHQSYQDYTLYIRDDGSTDSSKKIIKDFCAKNNLSMFNFLTGIYSIYFGRINNMDNFLGKFNYISSIIYIILIMPLFD